MEDSAPNVEQSPPKRRRRHWEVLFLCGIALILSPLLDVRPDGERVSVGSDSDVLLPPTCLSKSAFGIECPGCGLTRSFVHIAHGHFWESFHQHRIGWLFMAVCAFQVPYRLHLLYGSGRYELSAPVARWSGYTLIALLIGNWLLRMVGI